MKIKEFTAPPRHLLEINQKSEKFMTTRTNEIEVYLSKLSSKSEDLIKSSNFKEFFNLPQVMEKFVPRDRPVAPPQAYSPLQFDQKEDVKIDSKSPDIWEECIKKINDLIQTVTKMIVDHSPSECLSDPQTMHSLMNGLTTLSTKYKNRSCWQIKTPLSFVPICKLLLNFYRIMEDEMVLTFRELFNFIRFQKFLDR